MKTKIQVTESFSHIFVMAINLEIRSGKIVRISDVRMSSIELSSVGISFALL